MIIYSYKEHRYRLEKGMIIMKNWTMEELVRSYGDALLITEGCGDDLYYVYDGRIGADEFIKLVTNELEAAINCARDFDYYRESDDDYVEIRKYKVNYIDADGNDDFNYDTIEFKE